MRPGIALRSDYDAAQLWALAKATRDAGQSRRLLALAEIYDGGSRTKAARIGGVGLQTLRDWVVRFNARGPDGLIDGKAPGNTCKLNDRQRQAVVNIVESGPMPAIHGVVRWRLKDLAMWVWEEFQISLSETTLSRELRSLGYLKLSARPRHDAQNPEALELFKKVSPPPWRRSGRASRRAPRSSCGGRTRRAWARRTRSPAAGPDGERDPALRTTRGPARSTSSGRSQGELVETTKRAPSTWGGAWRGWLRWVGGRHDTHSQVTLRRLPLSRRGHQPRRLALLPLSTEPAHDGRDAGGPRHRREP